MIQVIHAGQRHFLDMGWLQTYWLFSFSNYFDPRNVHHGALRVFNDDVVQPNTGFPTHPHEEMEIVSIVLEGELAHKDSMGNEGLIRAGEVQRMSAGTGLTHSEYNPADTPVHFYQIWIQPDVKGLSPSYDQKTIDPSAWQNRLCPLASGQSMEGAVTFHTDATIYRAALDAGKALDFEMVPGRKLFIYQMAGNLLVNDKALHTNDQARIEKEMHLKLSTKRHAEFVLIDACP